MNNIGMRPVYRVNIGDGKNFEASNKYGIWGSKKEETILPGALLLFMKPKNQDNGVTEAIVVGFADYVSIQLFPENHSYEQLGWVNPRGEDWKYEIKYKNFYKAHNIQGYKKILQCANPIKKVTDKEAQRIHNLYIKITTEKKARDKRDKNNSEAKKEYEKKLQQSEDEYNRECQNLYSS